MTKLLFKTDSHIPFHDRRSLDAVKQFAQDIQPDIIVDGGDFMDFDMISQHNHGKIRLIEDRRIYKDYKVGESELADWKSAVPDAKLIHIQGNHDYRIERYIDQHPATEGMLEVETVLDFESKGIQWVPYWENGKGYKIGNALFVHGLYTNEHHAKKHVDRYGQCVFYGHVHDFQMYSKVMEGTGKTLVGQSMGCLCKEEDQAYMQGKPSRWQQGFGYFHIYPNGYFNYYPIMIFKNKFIGPNGKEYRG